MENTNLGQAEASFLIFIFRKIQIFTIHSFNYSSSKNERNDSRKVIRNTYNKIDYYGHVYKYQTQLWISRKLKKVFCE